MPFKKVFFGWTVRNIGSIAPIELAATLLVNLQFLARQKRIVNPIRGDEHA
jgi:hypothetical protein